jgi:hypothetical protein
MSQFEIRWNEQHIVPSVTGKDCEWASWLYSRYGRKNTFLFWDSVRDLMLAGFCCLIMIGCGSAEVVSPEVAKRAEELSAPFVKQIEQQTQTLDTTLFEVREIHDEVKQNTTALAAIKSQIDTLEASVVSSKPKGKEVIQSSEPPATANDTPKSSQVATPAASSSRIASDGTRLRWNIEGNWNPTILETSAHLREHGIDTNGMTHQQMADLHASIHEGNPVAMKSKSVQFVSRGASCPGGVCPTPRRGLYGKRR